MKTNNKEQYLKIERRSPRIAVNIVMLEFMQKLLERELKRSSKAYNPDDIYMIVLWIKRIEKALEVG